MGEEREGGAQRQDLTQTQRLAHRLAHHSAIRRLLQAAPGQGLTPGHSREKRVDLRETRGMEATGPRSGKVWVTREGKGPEDAQRAGQAVRSLAPGLTPGPCLSPQTPRQGGGNRHSRACPDGGRG